MAFQQCFGWLGVHSAGWCGGRHRAVDNREGCCCMSMWETFVRSCGYDSIATIDDCPISGMTLTYFAFPSKIRMLHASSCVSEMQGLVDKLRKVAHQAWCWRRSLAARLSLARAVSISLPAEKSTRARSSTRGCKRSTQRTRYNVSTSKKMEARDRRCGQ